MKGVIIKMTISEHKIVDTKHLTRLPMNDIEVEQIVIASLIKFDSLRDNINRLDIEDFYNDTNKQVYNDIKAMIDSGNADFDIQAVPFKTLELVNYYTRPDILKSKFDHYYKRLKKLSNLRKLERIAYNIEIACQEDNNDIDIRNKYLNEITDIKPFDLKDITTTDQVDDEYSSILNYDWRHQIPTGFEAIDEIIGGFRNACFYAIAGVPGVGKSTFMLNIMQNIAQQGKRVLFACLEMPYREIQNKFISMLTEISTNKLTGFNHRATVEGEATSLATARGMVKDYDINYIGSNGLHVQDMADKIEFLGGVNIVFIDYLQLIKASAGKTRYEQITHISRDLKSISMKYNIPVITIASINRAMAQRQDKHPVLSDFRDSGNIEYDLDCAILLHRPSQFDPDTDESYAELNIAKNRYGKSNIEFTMDWLPDKAKFDNIIIKE